MQGQVSLKCIAEMDYQDRQLISLVGNEFIEKAIKEAEAQTGKSTSQKLLDVASIAFELTFSPLPSLMSTAIDAWKSARSSGLPVLPISIRQARDLTFPPGHPKYGIAYVAHPAKPDVYFPMSSFHKFVFEDKFREALDLLMYLGAENINVEHMLVGSMEFASQLSAKLPSEVETKAALDGGYRKAHSSRLVFSATLEGHDDPKLPSDSSWFAHEPTWQSISLGRRKFGLSDFMLDVSYLDDFGVNSSLKAQILKSGLEIGGSFQDHEATVWRLNGKFKK